MHRMEVICRGLSGIFTWGGRWGWRCISSGRCRQSLLTWTCSYQLYSRSSQHEGALLCRSRRFFVICFARSLTPLLRHDDAVLLTGARLLAPGPSARLAPAAPGGTP
jgi:hypothetical protein